MSRDYKYQVNRRSRRGRGLWWKIPGAGVLVLGFGAFLAQFRSGVPKAVAPQPQAATRTTTAAAPDAGGKAGPPHPRFDFYTILPDKEVIISDVEIHALKREERLQPPRQPPQRAGAAQAATPAQAAVGAKTGTYTIQVASFKAPADAERLRERLAAQGIDARVEVARLDRATYHRVKIGPFDSVTSADRTRELLRRHGYNSIVQRQK